MNTAYSNDVSLVAVLFLFFSYEKKNENFMLIFSADSIYSKCAQNSTYFQFGMATLNINNPKYVFGVCS